MSDHYNELTPAEHERLSILAEECAEVIQIIGKILRHGYESTHPNNEDGPNNREMLEAELGHVEFIKRMMVSNGDLDSTSIALSKRKKCQKIWPYLHHQEKI